MTSKGKIMSFFGIPSKKTVEIQTTTDTAIIKSDINAQYSTSSCVETVIEDDMHRVASLCSSHVDVNSVSSTFAGANLPLHPMFLGAKAVTNIVKPAQSAGKALKKDVVNKKKDRKDESSGEIVGRIPMKGGTISDITNLMPISREIVGKKQQKECIKSSQESKRKSQKKSSADVDTDVNSDSEPKEEVAVRNSNSHVFLSAVLSVPSSASVSSSSAAATLASTSTSTAESSSIFPTSARRSSRQADLVLSNSENLRRLKEDSFVEDDSDFINDSGKCVL